MRDVEGVSLVYNFGALAEGNCLVSDKSDEGSISLSEGCLSSTVTVNFCGAIFTVFAFRVVLISNRSIPFEMGYIKTLKAVFIGNYFDEKIFNHLNPLITLLPSDFQMKAK